MAEQDYSNLLRKTKHGRSDSDVIVTKSNWSKQNIPKSQRLESKYSSRIHLGDLRFDSHGKGIGVSINKQMQSHIATTEHNLHESRKIRSKDKKDRATTDMVLDKRTKLILYTMINMNLIHTIYGCISTGKEANVYYAIDSGGQEFAIKIYKTSILSFKDRRRYVKGEYRFERGYSKNPRKMVAMWAEKEFRNLKRLQECGIPSPIPIYQRQNVLLMKFISNNSNISNNSTQNTNGQKLTGMIPAPRLKDIKWQKLGSGKLYGKGVVIDKKMPTIIENDKENDGDSESESENGSGDSENENENENGMDKNENENENDNDNEEDTKLCKDNDENEKSSQNFSEKCKDYEELIYKCYIDCIRNMRRLYWECKLIHCDLSEYNLLYDSNNILYFIDVSQSVEPSHPESYTLLAMDCKNINEYFRKQNIGTLTHKELFDYIVDDSHVDKSIINEKEKSLWKDIKHKEKVHFHPRKPSYNSKNSKNSRNDYDNHNNKNKKNMKHDKRNNRKPIKYGNKIVRKVKNEIQKEIATNLSQQDELQRVISTDKNNEIINEENETNENRDDKVITESANDQQEDCKQQDLKDDDNANDTCSVADSIGRGSNSQLDRKNVINEEKLCEIVELCKNRFETMSDLTKQEHLDNIDLSVSIPHNLFDIGDEFHVNRSNAVFQRIENLTMNTNKNNNDADSDSEESNNEVDENDSNDESGNDNDDDNDNDGENDDIDATTRVSFPMIPASELQTKKKQMSKEELKALRKKNKQLVKEANKERRKHKLPKHVKKRKIKVARQKAGKKVWKG